MEGGYRVMSKVVDERIVSMQFDNRNFEKNIQGTLSTLDKFNEKLKFNGATKGLENVSDAARKVDMNPLAKGVETVVAKFSALDVMAVTALANITNSAINAGKKLVSSLLIEPKSDGFKEYELLLNSIQTTMAGTGKTAKEVEDELKKLDEYADKTVYSTADMLNNLPKFTNAGVELEKATTAMIGIANATALAGGDAGKASIAFYNLGQAIGTGYLSRMDYNSINNAGIATMEWKNQMVKAAIAQGTLTKAGEDAYKAGNKTYTLQQLFIDGLQTQWATTDVMMEVFGKYGNELDKEVGEKAYAAAQNIKTFTQMMESLKATAGTGWKDTWQIIFGDLDGATKLWTGVANAISGVLTSMADFRNTILESALGRGFSKLGERISSVLEPVSKTADNISDVVDSVKNYSKIVDQIIGGEFGNGTKRIKKLTEAGIDWAHAQNLVNEKLGSSVRHATKYSEAQEKVAGEQKKVTETDAEHIAQLVEKNDAELEALGLTKDQIKTLRELKREADKTGYSVEEFVENINEINGRSLLLDSFKNIAKSIATIFTSIKDAWVDVFDVTPEGIGQKLYDLIAGFHKLTSALVPTSETADKMKRTFEGLFAALDIVFTIVGGPLKIAFKVLGQLLGVFDLDIWDITAKIGDSIVAFRDWLDSVLDFTGVFEKLKPAIEKCIEVVREFVALIKEKFIDAFNKAWPHIEKFFEDTKEKLSDLKDDFQRIGQNILSGLKNGLKDGAKGVWDAIVDIGNKIIEKIKNVLGIHSPSTVMEDVGLNTMLGFIQGLGDGSKDVLNFIMNLFRAIAAFFPSLKIFNQLATLVPVVTSMGSDVTAGFTKGLLSGAATIYSAIADIVIKLVEKVKEMLGIHSPSTVFLTIGKFLIAGLVLGIAGSKTGLFKILGNIITWIKDKMGELVDYLASIKWPQIKMEHILGIGALVGLIVFVKKLLDVTTLFGEGVKAFGDGVKAFGNGVKNLSNIGKKAPKTKFESFSDSLLKIAASVAILAGSVMLLTLIEPGKLWGAIGAITALVVILTVLSIATSKFEAKAGDFGKINKVLLMLAGSLFIMSLAIRNLKFLAETDSTPILVGVAAMVGGLVILIAALGKLTKGTMAKNIDKAMVTISKIALTMFVLTYVIKMISKLDENAVAVGIGAITLFGAFIIGLMYATQLAGRKVDSVGATILKLSVAMGILVMVIKMISMLQPGKLAKGIVCMTLFGGLITGLIAATKLAGKGKDLKGIAGVIIGVSTAMILMAVAVRIVAGLSLGEIVKGTACIAAFGGLIVALVAVAKTNEKQIIKASGTILAMSIAVATLAVVSIILSMVSVEGLLKGVTATSVLCAMLALMVHGLKGANEVKGSIIAMTVAIGLLVGAIVILTLIDPKKLAIATAALSGVMGMFALLLKTFSMLKTGKKTIGRSIAVLGVILLAVAALGGILVAMARWSNPDALIPSATALSILLMAMSTAFTVVSKSKSMTAKQMTSVMKMLGIMTGVIAALAVVLSLMSLIPNPNALIPITMSLSSLMIVMSGLVAILSKLKINTKNALTGVLSLTAMVVPLVAFGVALSLMPNVSDKLNTIIILTGVMTAMTVLLLVLSGIGAIITATGGGALLGIVGLVAMIAPLIAFAYATAAIPDVSGNIASIQAITNVMWEMTKMLAILAIVAPLALMGVQAMASFELLMLATGVFAVAVGALMEKFPALQTFLDSGIDVLKRLAKGIGEIISSFAIGLLSEFPELGTLLSEFMDNLSGFISGANSITDDLGNKVKILTGAILALTVADLIAGVSSWLQNGSSFAKLGTELSAFMINAMPFITALSFINPEALAAVKNLADVILTLTAANILDGLTSWFAGSASLADFGAQLAAFGPYMATYAAAVSGIDGAAVEASANAGKALAEMAATLPNSGGLVSWFAGDNNMDTFGTQLVSFGRALKSYSLEVTGIAIEAVMQSVEAGKALADLASVIPNLGGVVTWFTGDNDIATFGTKIVSFGNSLKSYSLAVSGIVLEPIMQSVEAGKALAGLNEAIPNLGGMVTWFTGDNDIATFGTKIVSFGSSLLNYSIAVAGLNIAAITTSISAARELVELANIMPTDGGFWAMFKDDKIDFTTFGIKIQDLGKGIVNYSNSVSKINSKAVSSSITSAKNLVALIKNMAGLDTNCVATFSNAIGTLGQTSVDKFVKAFTSSTSKLKNVGANLIKAVASGAESAKGSLTNVVNSTVTTMNNGFTSKQATFKATGPKLINAFISGITSKKQSVYKNMQTVASRAVTGARDKYDSFKNAGSYAVSGFVKGINNNKFKATDAGSALGKAAYKAAKKAIESNSPSKKFMELGKFSDEGLAKGLTYYAYLATRASAKLGEDVLYSMQDELGIHSPAKVIKDEVGKYVVEGLAEGIKKDMTAEQAAEQKAKNIVDAFSNELKKHDTNMTTSDLEFELWEVQNESATAAEKTAQKAASIYKRISAQTEKVALAQGEYEVTFKEFGETSERTQEAYNKWIQEQTALNNETKSLLELRAESIEQANELAETRMKTSDLEYEKWEQDNKGATEAEKASKSLEITLKKIEEQAANTGRAQAIWEDAKERYGKDSVEAHKAYNEFLQSQIDLGELTNSVGNSYEEALGTQRNAQKAYLDLMRDNNEKMLAAGISQKDIEAWARKESGYDPDMFQKLMSESVDDAATNAAVIVDRVFTECMNNKAELLGVAYGTQLGENIASGTVNATSGIESAVQTATGTCVAVASEQKANWAELGRQFVEEFAQGITNSISTASQATITMITSAYQAAVDYINNSENEGYTFTPRITPILDLSGVQNGVGQVNGLFAANTAALADINVRLTNDSITELSELTEKMRLSNEANHSEIVNAIKNLKGDFNNLVEALDGMHIRLDGNAVVGELVGKIDTSLGQIANYKRRGI